MDEIKTVDDLIKAKNLTEAELDLFGDVIKEARERELRSAELSRQTKENLNKLSDDLNTIVERTSALSKSLTNLLDQMESLYIRVMPETKFYRE